MKHQSQERHGNVCLMKPNYGSLALRALIGLAVYHVVTYCGYSLMFYKLEEQMIKDGTTTGYAWILFAYAVVALGILSLISVVLYHRNETRMEAYLFETSMDNFGHKGAIVAEQRHNRFAMKESLLVAGVYGLVWFPVTVVSMLAGLLPDVAWLTLVADKAEIFFIGMAGLLHPFNRTLLVWIGYVFGMLWVFVLRYFGCIRVHLKWDMDYAE